MVDVKSLLEDYPVCIELPVQWGEMDSYGHVNNSVYFRYFETARMHYFDRLKFQEVMDTEGVGPILAHTECRFRLPLTHPDSVLIGACIGEIGEDRFRMDYRVVSRAHARVAAEGTARVVSFDYRANVKAPLPVSIRERIAALQGDR